MRFGACTSIGNLRFLKEMGMDYIELNFSKICEMPESELREIAEQLSTYGMEAETFNGFFPASFPLYTASDAEIREYVVRGFSRAASLGGRVAVLGSGGARSIPEGKDRTMYEDRFSAILKLCGDVAEQYGMVIAIEPLAANECNYINTVAEGMELCRKVGHSAVKCLADYYHMFCSGEDFSAIIEGQGLLAHVHLARRNEDRYIPKETDLADCALLAAALKAGGYDARISLEGRFRPDLETALREVQVVLDLFR